jgi:hypothetical protein
MYTYYKRKVDTQPIIQTVNVISVSQIVCVFTILEASINAGVGVWEFLNDQREPTWVGFSIGLGPGVGGSGGPTVTQNGW